MLSCYQPGITRAAFANLEGIQTLCVNGCALVVRAAASARLVRRRS